MSAPAMVCPKCQAEMVQGFVADFGHGNVTVSNWVEGHPQASFWTGTKVPKEKCLPIGAFRCSGCGFLKFYAHTAFKKK